MRRVVIDMQNFLFADAIAQVLKTTDSDFDVYRMEKQEDTASHCQLVQPYALLMEVTGYPPYALEERMKIRDVVKAEIPTCKIVFLVDENSEKEIAQQVLQTKRDGLIDQFIYGSISASYLAALLDTL